MIVLVVLVVLGALVLPTFTNAYARYRLQENAETIRARLAGARIRAIDAGVDYYFLYEPGGRRFCVIPSQPPADESAVGGGAFSEGGATASYLRYEGELPEAFLFAAAGGGTSSTTQRLEVGCFQGLSNPQTLAGVNWAAPIEFRPDGTALEGSFDLVQKDKFAIQISVRGLTAAPSLGAIRQETLQ